ncbi:MAG: hypothetical protein COA53_00905 [Rhodobacteraceae bacterium]|nr:MAG: hypothetical protein COA53_00905 [Paracoccaceae bacterium]
MVNISSFFHGCDDTCLLNTGDHPFVRHPSYVFYAESVIYKATSIQNGFDQGILKVQPDLADDVFARVADGITISPDTPQNVVRYFTQL